MTESLLTPARWVQELGKYVSSKPIELIAADLGMKVEDIALLDANENPYGMSQLVKDKVSKFAVDLNRYPDADACYLQKALSDKYGVPQDWIVVTNGSSELLGLVAQTMLSVGTNAVYPQYSFSLYPMVVKLCGAEAKEITADSTYNADLDAMAAAIDQNTRLVFLTNPNNPTGTYLKRQDIVSFIEKVPANVMVLLDEAYVDFLAPELRLDSIGLIRRFPNVLITRTFSKAYGLAGCRVGYGIAQPQLINFINRVRHPYSVNNLSQKAAVVSLEDKEFVKRTVENNQQGIKQLTKKFDELGLPYMGLHANFITVKVGDGKRVIKGLLAKGIVVREMASYKLPEWIRVTVGTYEQNEKFLEQLQQLLKTSEQ